MTRNYEHVGFSLITLALTVYAVIGLALAVRALYDNLADGEGVFESVMGALAVWPLWGLWAACVLVLVCTGAVLESGKWLARRLP